MITLRHTIKCSTQELSTVSMMTEFTSKVQETALSRSKTQPMLFMRYINAPPRHGNLDTHSAHPNLRSKNSSTTSKSLLRFLMKRLISSRETARLWDMLRATSLPFKCNLEYSVTLATEWDLTFSRELTSGGLKSSRSLTSFMTMCFTTRTPMMCHWLTRWLRKSILDLTVPKWRTREWYFLSWTSCHLWVVLKEFFSRFADLFTVDTLAFGQCLLHWVFFTSFEVRTPSSRLGMKMNYNW